jgi:hypothetical protein
VGWSAIPSIVLGLSVTVGLLVAIRSRNKGGQKKVDELCQHLQGIGVKASEMERDISQGKLGQRRSWGQNLVGTIKLTDRNIDSINVVGVATQYGAQYFLDYLVRSGSPIGRRNRKKTRMTRKKSSVLRGRVIDIDWKGDASFARKLNFDYQLKQILLQADPKISIEIFPGPKYDYARIKTTYLLPTPDFLESMDIIAKHINSWY